MELQLLLANRQGKTRRVTVNGRDKVVVPMVMLQEQVLAGSKGPLFYSRNEIAKAVQAWNGMPITVNHPQLDGLHVSARHPEIVAKQKIGEVYNAHMKGHRLHAEGWIDLADAKRVDERVYNALMAEAPVECSTGLFTFNVPSPGVHNGRSYAEHANDHVPDHLAVLPDAQGACSVADGCGLNVNQQSGDPQCPTLGSEGAQPKGQVANVTYEENTVADQDEIHAGEDECDCGGTCDECKAKAVENAEDAGKYVGRFKSFRVPVAKAEQLEEWFWKNNIPGEIGGRSKDTKWAEVHFDKPVSLTDKLAKMGAQVLDDGEWTESKHFTSKDSGGTCEPGQTAKQTGCEPRTDNAGKYGNPQSGNTGQFKRHGSGTGKGEAHEAAQGGAMILDDDDWRLGTQARNDLQALGHNPAGWVADESVWERAKTAAGKTYSQDADEFWPAVTHIYKRMGGAVKKEQPVDNANPEGCNQYKECGTGIGDKPRAGFAKRRAGGVGGDKGRSNQGPAAIKEAAGRIAKDTQVVLTTSDGEQVIGKFKGGKDGVEVKVKGERKTYPYGSLKSMYINNELEIILGNANPEGCNQHTGPGCGGGGKASKDDDEDVISLPASKHGTSGTVDDEDAIYIPARKSTGHPREGFVDEPFDPNWVKGSGKQAAEESHARWESQKRAAKGGAYHPVHNPLGGTGRSYHPVHNPTGKKKKAYHPIHNPTGNIASILADPDESFVRQLVTNAAQVQPTKGGAGAGSPVTNGKEPAMALKAGQRAELQTWITVNCDCYKSEGMNEVLNGMTDDQLIAVARDGDAKRKAELALNQATKPYKVGKHRMEFDAEVGRWTANAGAACAPAAAEGEETDETEEYDAAAAPPAKKKPFAPAMNAQIRKAGSMQEWFLMAPDEAGDNVESVWNEAVLGTKKERSALITNLSRHLDGIPRQQLVKELDQLRTPTLRTMQLTQVRQGPPPVINRQERPPVDYTGAGGPPIYNVGTPDEEEVQAVPSAVRAAVTFNQQSHKAKYREPVLEPVEV